MMNKILSITSILTVVSFNSFAQKTTETKKDPYTNEATYSALNFRSIGPAVTSGRVGDIAVNPKNKSEYYVVAAAGGVWKTINNGITFEPIFDNAGSYSIGCISIDPQNSNVLWVGTGENNNQRAVGYGDGVYKSEDAGKTWKNVGLSKSEHIGRISIDPYNSDVVYVAAYGPLWSSGGERGIYKTMNGGKTWSLVLSVSENTGFNDVLIDPNHTNIIYAAAHQRQRKEWIYVSGGPESALYKSTDNGTTWNKLTNGLPTAEMGRIGLAISPANTDFIYAIIESDADSKGFYRSTDRGASWTKRGPWATAGNYYQEIVADPKNVDKIYSLDTWAQVSNDGGKTFTGMGEKNKHVDNHALYIEPENTKHMLMGCDGGLYETYDGAITWQYKSNLPITQFYKVTTDNAKPFYNVYGGTQDNNSLGGPSRTVSATGIINADWFVTVGGDGFESQVDPNNPNIVYSQWQYGGLIRFDRKTGEAYDIKPQEKEGEPAYRFNWDAPLQVSAFSDSRLYFCANKVFRTDDRGSSWTVISPDLSRGIDRNKIPLMGKVWSMDAVAKNQSTTIYGNITAFHESPKNEKILYAGTDDGLFQSTTDGGTTWTKVEKCADVPNQTRCQNILGSQHNENLVYAVFNGHRLGDFKPYVLKSLDKGKTWTSISANLPTRGSAYCIVEDHKNPSLLFVGTEFGIFFTIDAGKSWMQLKGGLPNAICVPDLEIQKRENDLVIATFGRGFFILDDYSMLQNMKKEDFDKPANIFPIKEGLVYVSSTPYGHKGKSFQGASFFNTENPPVGATINYFLKNDYKTIKDKRKESEKEKIKNNQSVFYPTADSIRLEDKEEAPYVYLQISDEKGNIVRKLKQSAKKGLYRITWDARYSKASPVNFYSADPDNPYESDEQGHFALPGKYSAQLFAVVDDKIEKLGDAATFSIAFPNASTLPLADKEGLQAFYGQLDAFRSAVMASSNYLGNMQEKVKFIKAGLLQANKNTDALTKEVKAIEKELQVLDFEFNGDGSLARREFETLPGINGMVENMVGSIYNSTAQQPKTYEAVLFKAENKFRNAYNNLKTAKSNLEILEKKLDEAGIPFTPGRLPNYNVK